MRRAKICFDFDGVIHSNLYYRGAGVVNGALVPGVKEMISRLCVEYEVVVYSARCATEIGYKAVRGFLDNNGLSYLALAKDKPRAKIYVDDRAVLFTGDCEKLLRDIKNFSQWQEKEKLKNRIMRKRVGQCHKLRR